MTKFVNGEADVLLSTTIIESGLDIPNANTIIIDRADRFGLSDLYQLRGRVGRYKHKAYAYLLLPRHTTPVDRRAQTHQRHQAILHARQRVQESPCATWKFAARATCSARNKAATSPRSGFELYCQLLKQASRTLKGEKSGRGWRWRCGLILSRRMSPSSRSWGPRGAAPGLHSNTLCCRPHAPHSGLPASRGNHDPRTVGSPAQRLA